MNKVLIPLRIVMHGGLIAERFAKSIRDELLSLDLDFSQRDISIVDIGSGVGGIDVMLYAAYGNPQIILVDKTATDSKVWYGFKEKGSFYNSFKAAKKLLTKNGVPASQVRFMAPDTFQKRLPEADLIISLISWGYHYPVSEYIHAVSQCLRPGGTLILDVRDPAGQKELENIFGKAHVLQENKNSKRLKFTRSISTSRHVFKS